MKTIQNLKKRKILIGKFEKEKKKERKNNFFSFSKMCYSKNFEIFSKNDEDEVFANMTSYYQIFIYFIKNQSKHNH